MNRPNSSLDWVLSHWAHFTVLRLIFVLCITVCTLHACVLCSIVTWWGGPGGIDAWSLGHYFLQCFDTVGWVIWPVKTDMTYNVFSGTLNRAQSINLTVLYVCIGCKKCSYTCTKMQVMLRWMDVNLTDCMLEIGGSSAVKVSLGTNYSSVNPLWISALNTNYWIAPDRLGCNEICEWD